MAKQKTIANKRLTKKTVEVAEPKSAPTKAETKPVDAAEPKSTPSKAKKAAEPKPTSTKAKKKVEAAEPKTTSIKAKKKVGEAAEPKSAPGKADKEPAEGAQPKSATNKSSDKKLDALAYWTPERMRNATLHPSLRAKKPGKTKPKLKVKGAPEKLAKPSAPTKRAAAPETTTYDTSLVADVRDFPYSTIGKIYLTSADGNDYYATGYVVGHRCVFTVASVLWSKEGGWASNAVFYPQYNNGPGAGLGAFTITEMWVAANWQEQGGLLNNFGALITTVPIQDFTGSVGLMANYPPNQGQYLVIGYPGTPKPGHPFDGERMWQSVSAFMNETAWIIQAGSNLTYGAHGAPWLIFREGGWYANGVFSVQVVDPDSILSPYFGNEVWAFFTYLRNQGYI